MLYNANNEKSVKNVKSVKYILKKGVCVYICVCMSVRAHVCACGYMHTCVCVCVLPDKVPAVGAVGGLSQVGGHELVAVDLMDAPADRPLPTARPDTLAEHPLFIVIGPRGCQ